MRIKNYELESLQNFLMDFELKGKQTRLRTRFVRLLAKYVNAKDEEHVDLIKAYSNLDENMNPIMVELPDGRKKYDMTDENLKQFNIEYSNLMNENVILKITDENSEMIDLIKELILNCDMTFKGEEALKYERFCEIVEELE